MSIEEEYCNFWNPNPVVVPRSYSEADIRNAKAEALEEAAGSLYGGVGAISHWLRGRASALRDAK